MNERQKELLGKTILQIGGFMLVIIVFGAIYYMYQPEYTPNQEYFHQVEEWAGYKACCDMTWLEMCEAYKENKSVEFDCFT